MKRLPMLIPLVFLCCLGCQQGERVLVEPKPDVEADIQAIKDMVVGLEVAMNEGDGDKYISFYSNDAVEVRPNEPASIGIDLIRNREQRVFDNFTIQEKNVINDIKISGDLAIAHLTWKATLTPKAGGEPIEHSGNWILAFEKQAENTWEIIYSIWSDEKLINPDKTA